MDVLYLRERCARSHPRPIVKSHRTINDPQVNLEKSQ
jgi:hypothetical protein